MLEVWVVWSDDRGVQLQPVRLSDGATVTSALEAVGFKHVDELLNNRVIGIFSKVVYEDIGLRDGDRVEIYRPLRAEAREARRQRAAAFRKQRSIPV